MAITFTEHPIFEAVTLTLVESKRHSAPIHQSSIITYAKAHAHTDRAPAGNGASRALLAMYSSAHLTSRIIEINNWWLLRWIHRLCLLCLMLPLSLIKATSLAHQQQILTPYPSIHITEGNGNHGVLATPHCGFGIKSVVIKIQYQH